MNAFNGVYTLVPEEEAMRRSRRFATISAGLVLLSTVCALAVYSAAGANNKMLLLTGRTAKRHILITGYRAWGNMSSNPAADVASQLNGLCWRNLVCFAGRTLPVNRAGAMEVANELAAQTSAYARWDAVVHLGYESISKGLRIETIAANVLALDRGGGGWSADVPCNKSEQRQAVHNTGNLSTGNSSSPIRHFEDIAPGAPCLLATTAPLGMIILDNDERGPVGGPIGGPVNRIPPATELWSRDAGTFYCNEVYYRTLHEVRARRIAPRWVAAEAPTPLLRPLLPVAFVHLPPLSVSPLGSSADIVAHLASLMAGRRLPSNVSVSSMSGLDGSSNNWASMMALAAAQPNGCYTASQTVLGEQVEVSVEVSPSRSVHASGLLDLSIRTSPVDASFRCTDVAWSLEADGHMTVKSGQPCWERQVLSEVKGVSMRYDSGSDTLEFVGHHRVNFLLDIPLSSTLSLSAESCRLI